MIEMDDDLARWLISQLDERGWSQRELGRRSELSSTTISQVLAGQQRPTFEFCTQVARALKVPPEQLFRLAGLLPGRVVPDPSGLEPERAEQIRRLVDRLARLPDERQRQIMDAVLMLLQAQEVISEAPILRQPADPD